MPRPWLIGIICQAAVLAAVPANAQQETTGTAPQPHIAGQPATQADCQPPSAGYLNRLKGVKRQAVDVERMYQGWLASKLIGQDVNGANGGGLGKVQDIIVGQDRRIIAITVANESVPGLAGTLYRIPWDKVERSNRPGPVKVAVTAQSAQQIDPSRDPANRQNGAHEFRVSQVRRDKTRIGNETDPCRPRHGYISDVVFNRDGRIIGVIESRYHNNGGGTYAYPFFTYQQGWQPNYGYYDLPLPAMSQPAPQVNLARFRPPPV